eukprot:TRINITY_DN10151_c0_g1_i1.p1 TRINITY_DN10151_c0_g1~~TRINITY_DN10151_c0_g1_i1.p1  ORF type:complete len:94 (+),score=5.60 TRINITY_DN10151_c0_g1_i1:80-361(+)
MRTWISSMGFGFALFALDDALSTQIIGSVFVFVALIILGYGVFIYYKIQETLASGQFRIPHRGIIILTSLFLSINLAGLVYLIIAISVNIGGS